MPGSTSTAFRNSMRYLSDLCLSLSFFPFIYTSAYMNTDTGSMELANNGSYQDTLASMAVFTEDLVDMAEVGQSAKTNRLEGV